MSNFDTPWFIEGALHSAQVARNIAYVATSGKQGIVQADDLQVLELATPGGSVRVTPGTCAVSAQGLADESYIARLPIEETVAVTPTDSTAGRSDLVVARIVNPAYEAAPDGSGPGPAWPAIDPDNGPFVQTYVYEGVPAGTTDVQAVDPGVSAITLARIDLPVSTATVTQGMIVDLRPDSVLPMSEAEADTRFVNVDGDSLTGDLALPGGNKLEFGHPSRSERFRIFEDDRGYLNVYLDSDNDGSPDVAALQILADGKVALPGPAPASGNDAATVSYVDGAMPAQAVLQAVYSTGSTSTTDGINGQWTGLYVSFTATSFSTAVVVVARQSGARAMWRIKEISSGAEYQKVVESPQNAAVAFEVSTTPGQSYAFDLYVMSYAGSSTTIEQPYMEARPL